MVPKHVKLKIESEIEEGEPRRIEQGSDDEGGKKEPFCAGHWAPWRRWPSRSLAIHRNEIEVRKREEGSDWRCSLSLFLSLISLLSFEMEMELLGVTTSLRVGDYFIRARFLRQNSTSAKLWSAKWVGRTSPINLLSFLLTVRPPRCEHGQYRSILVFMAQKNKLNGNYEFDFSVGYLSR